MTKPLALELDRSAKAPLAEQIRKGISAAIESGVLAPGARLPSWLDLAAQLGVARGTVRSAYEKLSSRAAATAANSGGKDAPAPRGTTQPAGGQAESGSGWGDMLGGLLGGGSRRESPVQALVKSAARSIGSQVGREIIRGVLGSMLGKRRR